MAEQEKKTFKWGDREYLLDDLLSMHAAQENNYYNFAKTRGQYDETALQGLKQAITNRINAVKSGQEFSGDGVLDTDIADNTRIQTQKKGLFKKEKYVDQDNTEWAKYYLNKLVSNLKPYEKAKSVEQGYNVDQHGFGAYLKGQGLNAKEIFEKNDLRDEENPDNPRAYTQRHAILRKQLTGYRDWLANKNFDFTKNDNEWDDNLLSDLNALVNSEKFDNNTLAASLRKLGAGDYVTAFTSDKYELSETSADAKKAKSDKERKDQIKAYNDAIANHYGIYEGLAPRTAQMTAYMGQSGSNFFRTPEEIREWSKNTKGVDINAYQQRYNTNKFDAEAAQYILPLLWSNGRLQKTAIDGVEYVYDPSSIDRQNYSFVAIDPVTGTMEQKFLYDIEQESAKLRNKYLKPQGAARYQIETLPFKEGGIISMQTGGNFDAMAYLKQLDDQDYKQRAAEQGLEERELKEAERTPMGEKTVINNSQFTGNDLVQLATMATNIGSMFLDPLSGAAVGAGTSVVDFFNDINRDGFQGKDAWNLVKNLGMDALGVVPVIGDTFGTLGKVKKGLLQMAPKIIGYLGMAQGIVNSPQIIDSFTKILDDRDMTVADWQNVASGINLIVSGTRMGKHAIKDARAKKASLQQDQLQVEVTDKAGNSKLLVLDGDNAKAVRDSDHSVEAVDKIIKDIEGMQDYTVNPKSSLFDFSLRMPGKKVKTTTGAEERSWNPFEVKTQKANVSEVYDPVTYARAYRGKNPTNTPYSPNERKTLSEQVILRGNKNQVDASGKQNLDQFKAEQQKLVDDYIVDLRKKAKAYGDKTNQAKNLVTEMDARIKDATTTKTTKESEISAQDAIIQAQNKKEADINAWQTSGKRQAATNAIKNARAKINKLANSKAGKSKAEQVEIDKKIKAQQAIIDSKMKELKDNSSNALSAIQNTRVTAQKTKRSLNKEIKKLETMLNSWQTRRNSLDTRAKTHSQEFNDLINFKPTKATFNGVDYEFKSPSSLTEADLLAGGLFKQGGSINRNKINKFLNYAKG